MDRSALKLRLTQEKISCSLSLADLRKLCALLEERCSAAAQLEVESYDTGGFEPEEAERRLKLLREEFYLHATARGTDGRELSGRVDEVLRSPNLPDDLVSLFLSSDTSLQGIHNYYPRNLVRLFLDFTRPDVLNFSFLPSVETPNASSLHVEGFDASWAKGVFKEVEDFVAARSSATSVVHRHSVYDVILYILGLPFAFWACSRLSGMVTQLAPEASFGRNALYVYVFAASLIVLRTLFHYMRWVLPLVEYRSSRSRAVAHRAALVAIAVAVFGAFVKDAIAWVFS